MHSKIKSPETKTLIQSKTATRLKKIIMIYTTNLTESWALLTAAAIAARRLIAAVATQGSWKK